MKNQAKLFFIACNSK